MTKIPLSLAHCASSNAFIARLKAKWRDESGVAAVEFALILPLMLTMYLGGVAVTKGIQAGRKVDLVAHAMADLTSQQITCNSNPSIAPCLTGMDIQGLFAAANAVIAPYSATPLKITVSQIHLLGTTTAGAYVNWSMTMGGAVARPCNGGGAPIPAISATKQPLIPGTPISPAKSGFETIIPTDLIGTASAPGNPGYLIVADVVYPYTPLFGFGLMNWSKATTINFGKSHFVRGRSVSSTTSQPTPIQFDPPNPSAAGVTIATCTPYI